MNFASYATKVVNCSTFSFYVYLLGMLVAHYVATSRQKLVSECYEVVIFSLFFETVDFSSINKSLKFFSPLPEICMHKLANHVIQILVKNSLGLFSI